MNPERICPDCGAALPADAPRGLCPQCLMGAALSGPAPGGDGATGVHEPAQAGVLATIAQTIGPVPRVLLRDTTPGEEPGPIVTPVSRAAGGSMRYRIDGEIARGGMGAVLKGRDPDLGRDVAVKVLRDDFLDDVNMVRRFVEEAQIGGQLQHPGVIPIYELGMMGDRRPFFSMKLVKGHTWAQLLAARPERSAALPRFLSIFEAVCQTIAYAHRRGVIHRDLKPSNVMVGSFGEVQVMDWGLAKVLPRGGVVDDAAAGKTREETVIATGRSGAAAADHSRAGSVMGTPSYMAPEQARGEIDQVDERADVFALGSILCEVLTGEPAFIGRASGAIQRAAALGDTAGALARLDASGADTELIGLAKDCLAREREDRPREASAVAERMTAYLAGLQERMRKAELASVEERDRRRLTTVVAASLLTLSVVGGLGFTYWLQQRQAGAARVALALKEATLLRDQAAAQPDDAARWTTALEGLKHAEAALAEGGDPAARQQLAALGAAIRAGAEADERDRALLAKLVDIRSAEADDPDGSVTDAAYADAFGAAGIDLASLPPAEAGAKIKARPESVALRLSAALDDWAATRRRKRNGAAGAARLSEAARIADPDPWRNELRKTLDQSDKAVRLAGLQALAKTAKFEELGPISLHLLGAGLNNAGDSALAESVLRTAQQEHPRDVWLNYSLGRVLEHLSRRDEAIRFYTAARSIRPETAHELAHALQERGDSDEALAVFRDLRRLLPANARHLSCLGRALKAKGLSREGDEVLEAAVAAAREAIRLRPDYGKALFNLGNALEAHGKLAEAEATGREAIRLMPDSPAFHYSLAVALKAQGKLDEAIAENREAIRLQPGSADAHLNLGAILCDKKHDYPAAESEFRMAIKIQPDRAVAHYNLGNALSGEGKFDEAIASYRKAIELNPKYPEVHCNLGNRLRSKGKFDEAIASYRKAIELNPKLVPAHSNLGAALTDKGEVDEAIAENREAIRLKPDSAEAHLSLGAILCDKKHDYPAAESEFRMAITIRPDHAVAHFNLGNALSGEGKFDEAIASYRKAIELNPKLALARTGLARAERLAAVQDKLPAFLKGDFKPTTNDERLALSRRGTIEKRYRTSAGLYADAFAADPKLADDLKAAHRYNAACSAALAAAGQGEAAAQLDDAEKARLRTQALDWLRADLALRTKQLESGKPADRAEAQRRLNQWQQDRDLAGLRDPAALKTLPEAERHECEALWAEVQAQVDRARKKAP